MSDNTTDAPSDIEPAQEGRVRGKLHQRMHSHPALALTTKVVVTTIGVLVMGAGAVMMVTPGPGIVGIALGLGILATEWEWADRWLKAAKRKAKEAKEKAEAMDPRIRRRRLVLTGVLFLVVVAAVAAYVAVYDWPSPAIDGWDWVQGLAGWVPDLPGM
ncbi:MAG TPA: PGPGW domain-containing protein [Nocardioidaceae bacterium]|nr:PGPGW domain-containing protein [Nocardioidaceae bacterium]